LTQSSATAAGSGPATAPAPASAPAETGTAELERGSPPARGASRPWGRLSRGPEGERLLLVVLALLLIPCGIALYIAVHAIPRPRGHHLAVVPPVLRVAGASVALFGLSGYGITRLFLPDSLRDRELLWVLPVGACTSGLALTVLCFVRVPFDASLIAVLVASAALSAVAVRRRGWGPRPGIELLGPGYLAAIVVAVAIVPMASLGYVTVTGNGSDAHLAAGTAQFLMHSYPTSVTVAEPVNGVPGTWQSKYPIYYAFAGVSNLAGLPTWQVLAALEGVMLALAAVGVYLLAREALGAPAWLALVAMGIVALDRAALRTGLTPFYNQTWGYFALPFSIVLAWVAVRRGPASQRRRAAPLLAVFLAIEGFAYPLALPLALIPLVVSWALERRERRRRGEPVAGLSGLYRGRRSLTWMVPLGLILLPPVYAIGYKLVTAVPVLLPGSRLLHGWAGDVGGYVPVWQFFGLAAADGQWVALAAVGALALVALHRLPRSLGAGMFVLLVLGVLFDVYIRHRSHGWYFHYKILSFIGPLVVLMAVLGAARLRRALALPALVLLLASAAAAGDEEIQATGEQLGSPTIALGAWSGAVPASASVRLDMSPPLQLWAAYFLYRHPLCSEHPLFSPYPRVPVSRKADYVLVHPALNEPADAIGPPLRLNVGYGLYRLRPSIPGPDLCSRARVNESAPGTHGPS
jgi:hypothetical protein